MNLGEIRKFEIKHDRHNLVTLELEEIAKEYKKLEQNFPGIAM